MKKITAKTVRDAHKAGIIAELLHKEYEDMAKRVGWKTQKECRAEFDRLPQKNKAVMLHLGEVVLELLRATRKDLADLLR